MPPRSERTKRTRKLPPSIAHGDRVNSESAFYKALKPLREKCRDVFGGVEDIVENAFLYFNALDDEDDEDIAKRAGFAALHGGYSQSIHATVGTVLQGGPSFEEDMPPALQKFAEDVDGAKTHLSVFAHDLLRNALIDGQAGILVEFTRAPTDNPMSPDEQRKAGMRVFWTMVTADEMTLPLYDIVNGVRTLVVFIRRTTVGVRDGRFGLKQGVRYQVYELKQDEKLNYLDEVQSSVWTATSAGEEPKVDVGSVTTLRPLKRIPFAPLVTGDESDGRLRPAFLSMANIVLQFHRTLCGMMGMLDKACNAPSLVRVGATKDPATKKYDPVKLGPTRTLEAPKKEVTGTDKPYYWLQIDASAVEPAGHVLDRSEAMMGAEIGAFFGFEPAGVESGKAKEQRGVGGRASMAKTARATKDCLETAYGFTGEYTNVVSGRVNVREDFRDISMDAPVMTVYGNMVKEGFPKRLVVIMFIKAGRLPADTNIDDTVKEWDDAIAVQREAERVQQELDAQNADENLAAV